MVRRADPDASRPAFAVAGAQAAAAAGEAPDPRQAARRCCSTIDAAPDAAAGRVAVRCRKPARHPDRSPRSATDVGRRRSAPARPGERRAGHGATPSPAASPTGSRSGFAPARGGPRASFARRHRLAALSPGTERGARLRRRLRRRAPPPTAPARSAGSGSTTSARSPRPRAAPRSVPICAATGSRPVVAGRLLDGAWTRRRRGPRLRRHPHPHDGIDGTRRGHAR